MIGSTRLVRHVPKLILMTLLIAPFWTSHASAETTAGADTITERVRHLLRRATFGVRPGDVEAAKKMGIEGWIDRQLKPELIADPDVSKRLAKFKTLKMTGGEYLQMIQGGAMNAGSMGPPKAGENRIAKARKRQAELNRLRYMGSREIPRAMVLRAVYSERQLHEVMKEFWRNHFNVDVTKDDVRYYITDWDREVLGKNVFGSFESLLMATAKHPAMLFYLDNHVSQAPKARGERVLSGREKEDRTGGLNENYARELMELHTLGADNGYTQKDVIQLSLVLTGWSINRTPGPDGGKFQFRENYHAKGKKRVVGKMVGNDGVNEGETLIRHLARHKNTAPYVVAKMARYLVADEPSQKLVDDVVAVWKKTKGDLGAVTKAMLTHDEFYNSKNVLTKAKTPFEFVTSCLRVAGADVVNANAVVSRLADMDQPLYRCEDPTGYSDAAEDWMDTGVLAERWQFAFDLLMGRLPGVDTSASGIRDHVRQQPDKWESLLIRYVLADESVSNRTLKPFRRRLAVVKQDYRKMKPSELERELAILATLLLGSAEFQRQ